uniref:Uncharacterized protein n=1 Tax=Borrelia garinii subsp. bavariensis (strain ATCC BAA-2496 / DSM 23469 / PBi) TaxID=290434 RepID=A0A7M4BKX1_BORGP|nr:hypothetical protein BGP209 [Borreliella bavariensis PBi]
MLLLGCLLRVVRYNVAWGDYSNLSGQKTYNKVIFLRNEFMFETWFKYFFSILSSNKVI